MSLLSYEELLALVARGVITNVDPEQINSASIDITLGATILAERMPTAMELSIGQPALHKPSIQPVIDLARRTPLYTSEYDCSEGFVLKPKDFILAQSEQVFNLPEDISCEYKLKSSMARIGMNHALAGWCDAGWNGSVLTLELMNVTKYHDIRIKKGDKIGQMIFFHHRKVPSDRSYAARGRYNNDTTVKGIKE